MSEAITDKWTDPTEDPTVGLSEQWRALKASHWVEDPHGELPELSGWAFAEISCSQKPVVAFRVPVTEDGWGYLTAEDAVAFGASLIRIAGAAQAAAVYENG